MKRWRVFPNNLHGVILKNPWNLAATKARHRQAVALSVNQVLIAYGDVEDALTDRQALAGMVAHLHEAVDASRNYLRVVQVQYKNGLVDYLVAIDAERTRLGNHLSLTQADNLQLIASIRLFKAREGGWDDGHRHVDGPDASWTRP